MKILIGQFSEEACSFAPQIANLDSFHVTRGSDIIDHHYNPPVNSELSGFLDVLGDRDDLHPIPSVAAKSLPDGVVSRETYNQVSDEILTAIEDEVDLDGVLLSLHGAMVVEGIGDGEGYLLEKIRSMVGPDIPVVSSLDLHAVVTEKMVSNSSALVGYRTAPHVDMRKTGQRAASILVDLAEEKYDVILKHKKIPLLVPGEKAESGSDPLKKYMDQASQQSEGAVIKDISIFVSDCWVDLPENGMTVTAVTTDEKEAKQLSDDYGQRIWEDRTRFDYPSYVNAFEPDEAVNFARKLSRENRTPFVVSDTGDNTTAGAPGDTTYLLREVLDSNLSEALFVSIVDPQATQHCAELGEGQETTITLGGKLGSGAEHKVELKDVKIRTVLQKFDYEGKMPSGSAAINRGPLVLVEVPDRALKLVLTKHRLNNTEVNIPRSLNVDLESQNLIIIKNGYLNDEYRSLGPEWGLALTPGATYQKIEQMSYRHLSRPIYPLDPDMTW
ncbi:MAG: M81 family metallopeptidase [Candidatus Bipolaricaulota bacterium]